MDWTNAGVISATSPAGDPLVEHPEEHPEHLGGQVEIAVEHPVLHGPGGAHHQQHGGAAAGLHQLHRLHLGGGAAGGGGYHGVAGQPRQHLGGPQQEAFRVVGAAHQQGSRDTASPPPLRGGPPSAGPRTPGSPFWEGTRPAEVWGCSKSPSSMRSAISFRTVAEDTPICSAMAFDPTGFAAFYKAGHHGGEYLFFPRSQLHLASPRFSTLFSRVLNSDTKSTT